MYAKKRHCLQINYCGSCVAKSDARWKGNADVHVDKSIISTFKMEKHMQSNLHFVRTKLNTNEDERGSQSQQPPTKYIKSVFSLRAIITHYPKGSAFLNSADLIGC